MGGIGLSLGTTLRGGGGWSRAAFATQFTAVMGSAPVAGYLPGVGDVLTSTDPWNGGTWTADATMAGQISSQGRGYTRAFASASSRYLTRPDAANQSFGNGTTDSACWFFALVNVTDTAAIRALITKFDTANAEYRWVVNANDTIALTLTDVAQAVQTIRTSDAAITQGALHAFWAFYDGRGGATAADGITLGMDSAVVASTATNSASYVAMGNLAAAVEIGSRSAHTLFFLDGSSGLAAVGAGASSLAKMQAASALCTAYFNAP